MANLTKALKETLDAIIEMGEATAKELAEKLGVSVSGLRKRLQKLVDMGLVEKIVDGKRVKFAAADANVETESDDEVEEVSENNSASAEASEDEDDDDLVDVYINGRYLVSVGEDEADEVAKRCNPSAKFERRDGNKLYYTAKQGSKG